MQRKAWNPFDMQVVWWAEVWVLRSYNYYSYYYGIQVLTIELWKQQKLFLWCL